MTAAIALYLPLGLPEPWRPVPADAAPTPLVVYGAASAVGAYALQFARRSNVRDIRALRFLCLVLFCICVNFSRMSLGLKISKTKLDLHLELPEFIAITNFELLKDPSADLRSGKIRALC